VGDLSSHVAGATSPMTKIARLLTVSFLVAALAPATPVVAAGHSAKAKKQRTTKKTKKRSSKLVRSSSSFDAMVADDDPGTVITDPGTTIPTDPGTTIPTDPGTTIPTDPGTTIPPPAPTGNPAQQCKAEMADPAFADSHDGKSFSEFYGTNHNLANAYGKCVSTKAHAKTR